MNITQSFQRHMRTLIQRLQRFVDRLWYPPLIGFLAALDNLILFIPNDGLLISSAMLRPRRWFALALNVAIGSALGALVLAALVKIQGLPWILELFPSIEHSRSWIWTLEFFEKYGLLLVFFVAISPFVQQPAVILASLTETTLFELGLVIFVGRLIKFLIMAYIGSHTPRLLNKLWGVKGELDDVGVKIDS